MLHGHKHPPHLKGKEIGLWYAKQNKPESQPIEPDVFAFDQKTTEKIVNVIKEVEAHGLFCAKQNGALSRIPVKSPFFAPSKNALEMLDEYELQSSSTSSDTESDGRTTSIIVNLKRNTELDKELRSAMIDNVQSPSYRRMNAMRRNLPTFTKKQEFLDLVDNNQVVVVSGETGSGKTTQLPQYLLEHTVLRGNGSCTRIVVTQPRRISAISVAERVASERAQKLGKDVGYQIRLEGKLPSRPEGSILFCTTGIVLQWFHHDPFLQSVSHILVDEVHEREMLGDFLVTMLKRILPLRPDLRVILMSATLNSSKFSEFFGNCPHLEIPGRTFPVESLYLEDVLRKTGYQMSTEALQRLERSKQHMAQNRTGAVGEPSINHNVRQQFKHWVQACPRLSSASRQFLTAMDVNLCPPPEFIAVVVDYIAQNCESGAILVFVPGIGDIKDVLNELRSIDPVFYGTDARASAILYPLHSSLTTGSQYEVFNPPPDGKRKIVVATNIAETSITIEDIVYVVDSGQIKITTYDPRTNTSTLAPVLVSKANATQRRGRAGRVREGKCFHLFSSFSYDRVMLDFLPPEITRIRLEDVILRIKALNLGSVTSFLFDCLDSPDLETIMRSLRFLREIQALKPLPNSPASTSTSIPDAQLSRMSKRQRDRLISNTVEAGKAAGPSVEEDNDILTPLGHHLAYLPLDPQCAKLLLLGALFCCLEPALAVAACLTFKDPFEVPMGQEARADKMHRELAENTQSDHWAFYTAIRDFRLTPKRDQWAYCRDNFLNFYTMRDICRLMQDFVKLLHERRYIIVENIDDPDVNRYSHDVRLFRAIIAGAFYPNFIMASAKKAKSGRALGGVAYRGPTASENVILHNKSVNAGVKPDRTIWFAYFQKMKLHHNAASTIFDTTMLNARPVVFFSKFTHILVGDSAHLKLDDWITLRSNPRVPQLVENLRHCLDRLLNDKVRHPRPTNWDSTSMEGRVMQTIADFFLNEAPPAFYRPSNPQYSGPPYQGQRSQQIYGRGRGQGRGDGGDGRRNAVGWNR